MKRKKKIIIIGIIILISILMFFPHKRNQLNNNRYEWNGGYCINDGGRLNYIGTGDKVQYQCEKCGKIYYFDGVMKYDKKEN